MFQVGESARESRGMHESWRPNERERVWILINSCRSSEQIQSWRKRPRVDQSAWELSVKRVWEFELTLTPILVWPRLLSFYFFLPIERKGHVARLKRDSSPVIDYHIQRTWADILCKLIGKILQCCHGGKPEYVTVAWRYDLKLGLLHILTDTQGKYVDIASVQLPWNITQRPS